MKYSFPESFCFFVWGFFGSGDPKAEMMTKSSTVLVLSAPVPTALPWAPPRWGCLMPEAGAAPVPSWLGWWDGPGCQALLFHDPQAATEPQHPPAQ